MSVISMKQLLEAGVHFGHQTRRWNPKMAPYIYTERNGIHIIDLQKSVGKVDEAYKAVSDIAADGGTILFVGTKKQAQDAIKTEAERCGMFYVNERWLGGMLTNFKTIQSRIARLKQIEAMSEDGTFDVLPKKEVIELKKEWEKLEKNLGGIKDMKKIPDAIFVVDPKKERICVQEAHTLGIPLIGIIAVSYTHLYRKVRLDHLLSKEEEVRVLYTVEFSRMTIKDWNPGNERFPVSMRLGDTPVPIPNTMVKT